MQTVLLRTEHVNLMTLTVEHEKLSLSGPNTDTMVDFKEAERWQEVTVKRPWRTGRVQHKECGEWPVEEA